MKLDEVSRLRTAGLVTFCMLLAGGQSRAQQKVVQASRPFDDSYQHSARKSRIPTGESLSAFSVVMGRLQRSNHLQDAGDEQLLFSDLCKGSQPGNIDEEVP